MAQERFADVVERFTSGFAADVPPRRSNSGRKSSSAERAGSRISTG